MGQEIESKMRLRDRASLVRKLQRLAGASMADFIETDIFLDTAAATLRGMDCGLRLRIEENLKQAGHRELIITFKGPRQHGRWKSREEIELSVTDEAAALALLNRLGYEEKIRFQKRRERWQVADCRVEVDTLPYLGDFVEVEGPDESAVTRVLEQLGMEGEPMIKESYVAMLHGHLEQHGISSRAILLPRGK